MKITPNIHVERKNLLKTIQSGIKNNFESEYLIYKIFLNVNQRLTRANSPSDQVLMIKEFQKEIERSKMIRTYNMSNYCPTTNRIIIHVLNELQLRIRVKFFNYSI